MNKLIIILIVYVYPCIMEKVDYRIIFSLRKVKLGVTNTIFIKYPSSFMAAFSKIRKTKFEIESFGH